MVAQIPMDFNYWTLGYFLVFGCLGFSGAAIFYIKSLVLATINADAGKHATNCSRFCSRKLPQITAISMAYFCATSESGALTWTTHTSPSQEALSKAL